MEEYDLRRYFKPAYEDSDMRLYVKTDSFIAARVMARAIADIMVERIKLLKIHEERKSIRE